MLITLNLRFAKLKERCIMSCESRHEKTSFGIFENKGADQISTFCFASYYIISLKLAPTLFGLEKLMNCKLPPRRAAYSL